MKIGIQHIIIKKKCRFIHCNISWNIKKEKGRFMEKGKKVEEQQIDLFEIFYVLKQKILWILVVGLLFGCGAAAYTQFCIAPTYTSTSSMLVLSKETTLTSMADLQLGTQLASDYQVLIKSKPVMEQVIENLELKISPNALKGMVSITNPANTRILNVSITSTDPEQAKIIVDELAAVASEYVGDKMEVIPPKIIEKGEIPTYKNGPNVKKNAFLGLFAGLFASAGVFALLAMMSDFIKTEEDIARYLDIPVLATVPDRKDYIGKNKKSRRKKKKH